MDALLAIDGLTVAVTREAGDISVVRGLTFDLQRGEFVGLVGESGCGKTMTALAIVQLLPEAAFISAGRIFLEKEVIFLLIGQKRRTI